MTTGSALPTLRYRTGYLRLMRDRSATHGSSTHGSRLMATIAIKSTTFLFGTDGYRALANVGRIQVQTRIPTT